MKVLIVDDDPVSRKKLEIFMADMYECVAVSDGKAAISSFEEGWKSRAPFAIVFLEIMLPVVDGRVVLGAIRSFERERNVPKEKRALILMVTGNSEEETIVSCVKAGCDDYIMKPFDKEVILRKLERFGFDVSKKLGGLKDVKKIISEVVERFRKGTIDLPVLSKIALEIQGLMDRPTSTLEDLSRIVEKDGVISLKLISTVNSPFYRGAEKITSVRNAIQRVGFKEARIIVSAIANKSLYKTKSKDFESLMEELWVHSLATAYGSKALAKRAGIWDEEKVFFMGLVHDIGKALLIRSIDEIAGKGQPMSGSEIMTIIQQVHTSFGGAILVKWGFPEVFIRAANEHEEAPVPGKTAKEVLIVHLANKLSRRIGFSLFKEEDEVPVLKAAELLNIHPGMLGEAVEETKRAVVGLQESL